MFHAGPADRRVRTDGEHPRANRSEGADGVGGTDGRVSPGGRDLPVCP